MNRPGNSKAGKDAAVFGRAIEPAVSLSDGAGAYRPASITDVVAVARGRREVALLDETQTTRRAMEAEIARSAAWVAELERGLGDDQADAVYGINTGFGALAGHATFPSAAHAALLQRNLLVSHAVGAGPVLDEECVRATVFVRAAQLARGLSGIRAVAINRLLAIINGGLYPQVPEMGSLGASGDLAPLAYIALLVSKAPAPPTGATTCDSVAATPDEWSGEAWTPIDPDDERAIAGAGSALRTTVGRDGRTGFWMARNGDDAMRPIGGRIVLRAKEGLALTNGTSASTGIAALAIADARGVLDHLELAVAMALEAARGLRDPFLAEVQAARGLEHQAACARTILRYVAGSTLLDPASREADPARTPPQDPYSLRCAPQVLGAARSALHWSADIVQNEISAAVDNPLVLLDLPRSQKAVSCGNFHGAPVGYAMDLLKIVMTDCASQSERRAYLLSDYRFEDPPRRGLSLPRFLTPTEAGQVGLNSGFMIAQYTAASLVSDAKTLAHPASVDSIPSSAGQEDHVSMSMNAARHARRIIEHAEVVAAIELLMAAQAISLRVARGEGSPGPGTGAALAKLRQEIPVLGPDRALHPDLQAAVRLLRGGGLVEAANRAAVHTDG